MQVTASVAFTRSPWPRQKFLGRVEKWCQYTSRDGARAGDPGAGWKRHGRWFLQWSKRSMVAQGRTRTRISGTSASERCLRRTDHQLESISASGAQGSVVLDLSRQSERFSDYGRHFRRRDHGNLGQRCHQRRFGRRPHHGFCGRGPDQRWWRPRYTGAGYRPISTAPSTVSLAASKQLRVLQRVSRSASLTRPNACRSPAALSRM